MPNTRSTKVTGTKNSKSSSYKDSPEEYLQHDLSHPAKRTAPEDRDFKTKSYRSQAVVSGNNTREKRSKTSECQRVLYKKTRRRSCSSDESSETLQDRMSRQYFRNQQNQRIKPSGESISSSHITTECSYNTPATALKSSHSDPSSTTLYCHTDSEAGQPRIIPPEKKHQV